MLHLLAHVVEEQLFQRLVFGIVGALTLPVDGIEFFHQRNNRKMQIERLLRKTLTRCVQVFARHNSLHRPLLSPNATTRGAARGSAHLPQWTGRVPPGPCRYASDFTDWSRVRSEAFRPLPVTSKSPRRYSHF
jgi:hypothetical protein